MVEPLLLPPRLVIPTLTVRAIPAVVMSLAANRVCPVAESDSETSHSGALENDRMRSVSARACSLVQLISPSP